MLVAIVGRPNVGKSTLFNRIVGRRQAIVDEQAGLTRDRLYARADWRGREFTLVDTAGLDQTARGELVENTRRGTLSAIEEADVIVFVVDVRTGLTTGDDEVAKLLRKGGRPVVLAANKAESPKDQGYLHDLYRLGLGEPMAVSALQGTGTGDLLDRVVDVMPVETAAEEETGGETAITIIGRPNVGKSSLLNALLGEERSIVASIPGTTRDPVDTEVEVEGHRVRLVDTAGIRRKGVTKAGSKPGASIEHYSLLRAFKALDRSDVALLVIDAGEGILAQDQHIAGYAIEAGKGVVLVVNKWDLLPTEDRDDSVWRVRIDREFQFIPGLPTIYASAKTRRGVSRVLPAALQVAEARNKRIPTAQLNRLLREAVERNPPPPKKGRQLKLLYAAQGKERTPTIVFFANDPELVHFSYRRYLENQVRESFGFEGVPLRSVFRRRSEED
jgi:GTP-binding protein